MNQYGIFSRSHAAPTRHPWAQYLKPKWNLIQHDLEDLEIFGESLYAIHSIEYQELEHHFFVFGIRCLDKWLSWEEVKFYAALLDFEVVPVLGAEFSKERAEFEKQLLNLTGEPSQFRSIDTHTKQVCSIEGVVSKNVQEYTVQEFSKNVFKYVRKNHVKTTEHWTRTWKRAPLNWEKCGN